MSEPSLGPRPSRMLGIAVAWGACFLFIRWGLRDAPVLWFAALRALIAGAALLLVAAAQRRPLRPRGPSWGLLTAMAVVNVTVAFAAMFAGTAGLATGAAAVLSNAQPLLILLPAWWFYGEAVSVRSAASVVVGFAGLVLVGVASGGGQGAWLSLLSAVAVTAGTLMSRRLSGTDLVVAIGWHFVIGGLLLVALAAAVEGAPAIAWTPRFVLALGFLSLIGTAAAFLAWFRQTQVARLDLLSAWTLLVPVIAMAVSAVLPGERPTVWSAVGAVIVLVSLALVTVPGRVRPGP